MFQRYFDSRKACYGERVSERSKIFLWDWKRVQFMRMMYVEQSVLDWKLRWLCVGNFSDVTKVHTGHSIISSRRRSYTEVFQTRVELHVLISKLLEFELVACIYLFIFIRLNNMRILYLAPSFNSLSRITSPTRWWWPNV